MVAPRAAPKYSAFLSYSHTDERLAKRVQRRLERVRVPPGVEPGVPLPSAAKLYPVFRDRTDASSGRLDHVIERALADSAYLIVLATPAAEASPYVRLEVTRFRELHGASRILVLGTFPASEGPPAWLADLLGHDPLCADLRLDGFQRAVLKLAAGMLGCELTTLLDRERERRVRALSWVAGAASVVAVTMAWLALDALRSRGLALEREYRANLRATRGALEGGDVRGADAFLGQTEAGELDGWERRVLATQRDASLRSFRASTGRVKALAPSADGALLVTLDQLGDVQAWSREDFTLVGSTTGALPDGRVLCVAADDRVVFPTDGRSLVVWDPHSGERFDLAFPDRVRTHRVVALAPLPPENEAVGVVTSLGDVFYVGTKNRHVQLTMSHLAVQVGSPLQAAAVSILGRTWHGLFCGSDGRVLALREAGGAQETLWADERSPCMILSAHLTPDGRLAAFGDSRGRLFVREIATGRALTEIPAHQGSLYAIAADADGNLWTAGREGAIACWTPEGREITRFPGHRAIAASLLLLDVDGRALAYSSDENGMVFEWDRTQVLQPGVDPRPALGFREGYFRGERTMATDYQLAGGSLATAIQLDPVDGNRIVVLDLASRRIETTIPMGRAQPLCMVGDILVALSGDASGTEEAPLAAVYGLPPEQEPRRLLGALPLGDFMIASVEVADGRAVVSASDGRALVWNPAEEEPIVLDLPDVTGIPGPQFQARLSPSGRLLAVNELVRGPGTSGRTGVITVVDLEGDVVSRLELDAAAASYGWDARSEGLWVAATNRTAVHLDLDGDEVGAPLAGLPAKQISALAAHPTEPRLVLGADDGTISVWNTEDGQHLVDLGVLAAGVLSLAFAEDGAILCASSVAGDFMYWTTLPPPRSSSP